MGQRQVEGGPGKEGHVACLWGSHARGGVRLEGAGQSIGTGARERQGQIRGQGRRGRWGHSGGRSRVVGLTWLEGGLRRSMGLCSGGIEKVRGRPAWSRAVGHTWWVELGQESGPGGGWRPQSFPGDGTGKVMTASQGPRVPPSSGGISFPGPQGKGAEEAHSCLCACAAAQVRAPASLCVHSCFRKS